MMSVNNSLYAGIDIGGTTIKTMIVAAGGKVIEQAIEVTGANPAEQVCQLSQRLRDKYPALRAIGILSPGIVDENNQEVVFAANLNLKHLPLARIVSETVGMPVKLAHDGRGAGLAEAVLGAGKDVENFLLMPIGTGISAALWLEGKAWEGDTYCGGEIGHSPVFPGGIACACGQRGCLEAYASAQALSRRYLQATGIELAAEEIVERAPGDRCAQTLWDEAIEALALAITHLTFTLDIERVILGGGLSNAGEKLLLPLQEKLREKIRWRKIPRLMVSALGQNAGQWGAVILGAQAAGSTCYENWQLPVAA